MHFGEYELSPSLIGLSLLHTPHPEAFQRLLVGTSIRCYPDFILDMCRSLGFASTTVNSNAQSALCLPRRQSRPLQARFHCGCASHDAYPRLRRQLVGSLCKRHAVTACAAPTACRRMVSGSISTFLSKCFSPFPHGTGSLSVSFEYLALPDGPGGFAQNSSCSALLRIPLCLISLRIRDYHPL